MFVINHLGFTLLFIYNIKFCCFIVLFQARNGYITLEDYISFMISRETENIQSLSEVEGAFRAITVNGDKLYVTKDEIFQVRHS